MKYFLMGLLLLSHSAFSQIIVSDADFADGGDVTWMSTALDPTIDFASTGTNYSWDFSSLTSTGQESKTYFDMSNASFLVNFMFGTFAGVDYQATNFTSSTALPLDQLGGILPVNITDVFQYSKNSSDSITSVGFSVSIDGNEVPFKSDVIETRYKFPLMYGDSYTSNGYTNLDMNPIFNAIWRQYRTRNTTVDGWGTVTTPYGTFDAIRVNHVIDEIDSLYLDLFGVTTWIPLPIPESHIYEWITNGEQEPILRITTNVIAGNEIVTNIEYKDNEIVGLEEESLGLSIFPNPVEDLLTIDGISTATSYAVYSVDGRQVLSGRLDGVNNQINTADLVSGKYNLILSSGDGQLNSSFLKK
ncbi:MAG: T9SS type A sorting domain-containing protein [Crocinitomicaceae bacterium]|nr:T9SS type A sorting domain-containing protein [Crocinitomicaceae bacterium]